MSPDLEKELDDMTKIASGCIAVAALIEREYPKADANGRVAIPMELLKSLTGTLAETGKFMEGMRLIIEDLREGMGKMVQQVMEEAAKAHEQQQRNQS